MDDRGRVPFALLGVFLLVSSATLVATTGPRRNPADTDVDVATDRATATTQTALRDAVRTASERAAAAPVIERANTTAGRVLNESTPFRDALRIRIYLQARQRLDAVTTRRGNVTVTATLPPTANETQLRAAKRRVSIEQADENGTALRVTIEDVTLTTRRNGQAVATETISPTVVVATPVMALHERASTYQRKLNADVTGRGLEQHLTAQFYALAWSRGYLQYGGVPISNVVSNQHLGVATNAALLDFQREVIGHSDPRGRRALAFAAGLTTARDLTVATETDSRITDALLDGPFDSGTSEIQGLEPPESPGPGDETRIGVNETADRAMYDLVQNEIIDEATESAYTIDTRLVRKVEGDREIAISPPEAPGENWTRVDQNRDRTLTGERGGVQAPDVPDGWHLFETFSKQTTIRETWVREWERTTTNENGTEVIERRTTRSVEVTRQNVSVAVIGRHEGGEYAPNRPIRTAHERGAGPLDGPNLADARERILTRTIENNGGRDYILESAARGGFDDQVHSLPLARPDNISSWVYRDLMDLREEVRAISVTADRGSVGTFDANPPAMLAQRLEERRTELLDAPSSYESTATKARIAARAAYLDRIQARLESRAADRSDRGSSFSDALSERGGATMSDLRAGMEAQERPSPERQPRLSGIGGSVRLTADTAPAYLTRGELTHDQIPAIDDRTHPLVTRNVNVFSVPHQTAADGTVDALFGTNSEVRLDTAARTLAATNETISGLDLDAIFRGESSNRTNESEVARQKYASRILELLQYRRMLQEEVGSANDHVIESRVTVLEASDVGDDADEREAMVHTALSPWETTHGRALALVNGSVDRRLAVVATERANLSVTETDRLQLRLNGTLETTLNESGARPATDTVNESRSTTQLVARELAREAAASATDYAADEISQRASSRVFKAMPSGLPLAPVPGYWYATTNVWTITVEGEYARFGIRASRGRPTTPGGEFAYVRDGSAVRLDVDQDGEAERLGRSSRVSFEVSTSVVVVVPPGGTGVGDVNGVTVERSEGWTDRDAE